MSRKSKRQFPGASPYIDRHGKRRWRFRKGGFSAELGVDYGSEDFVRRYEAAVEGQRTRGLSGPPGRFPAASRRSSPALPTPAFLGLSDSTRAPTGVSSSRSARSTATSAWRTSDAAHQALMAEKAETPAAANNLRKRLRQLLKHAIKLGWIKHNPAVGGRALPLDRRRLPHLD